MIKRIIALWLLLWLIIPAVAAADDSAAIHPFIDVPPESTYYLPVQTLKIYGIVGGNADGTFEPDRSVTRAEALAMIWRATRGERAKTKNQERKNPFRDVKEKHWFFDLVADAKKDSVIGAEKKYFRPNGKVNLAETLRMLYQSAEIDTFIVNDPVPPGIPEEARYAKDMAYSVSRTIITQQEDGAVFAPDRALNRGQLSLILYRFLKTQDDMLFGFASWYGDGLAKTKIPKGHEYKEKNLTAAHKTLPFGTILRVTNVKNGKSVEVVVNDRGPYVTGRLVDLSKSAFAAIENPGIGIISAQIEVQQD